MNRQGFLIPVLALASLFFGWRAYDAWTGPMKPPVAVSSSGTAAPIGISAEEPPQPPDLHVLAASVAARPVFRPDRRPFREDQAGLPSGRNYDAEISRLTLVGVLLLGKDRRGVVVGKGAAGRDERWEVAPGDSLPGFVVKEIGVDGITLTADGREFLLPLYAGGPKGQAPLRTESTPRGSTAGPGQAAVPAKSGGAFPAAQPAPTPAPQPQATGAPSSLDPNVNRARYRRQQLYSPEGR